LWKNSLNGIADLENKMINKLAKEFEISGGSIKNVIQFSWLYARRSGESISYKHLIQGIRRELLKDGKTLEMNIDG